ncbi:9187_t:CDS:1, partial [Racocetra fulgida]
MQEAKIKTRETTTMTLIVNPLLIELLKLGAASDADGPFVAKGMDVPTEAGDVNATGVAAAGLGIESMLVDASAVIGKGEEVEGVIGD